MPHEFVNTRTAVNDLLPYIEGEYIRVIIAGVVHALNRKASTAGTDRNCLVRLHNSIGSALWDDHNFKRPGIFDNEWRCVPRDEGELPLWICYADQSADTYWVFVPASY